MSAFDDLDALASQQKVRLFDIYALGPFLIWAATRKRGLGRWEKRTLFIAGCMTMVYNWKRYKTLKPDLEKAIADVQQRY